MREYFAPAKINLGLDVIGKNTDGYHTLETVFQTVSLYDRLWVSYDPGGHGISLTVDNPNVPSDKSNLAWQAAERFLDAAGLSGGVAMVLEKHIPSEAGLGGGSSDAATTLRALRELCGNPLPAEQVRQVALSLGADVPFLLAGGTAYATGVGERLSPLPPFLARHVVLAKGRAGVSTKEAYAKIDALQNPVHPPVRELRDKILQGATLEEIAPLCGNLFEQVALSPESAQIKAILLHNGALCGVLTGSGAAVFGIFGEKSQALAALKELRDEGFPFLVLCGTSGIIER